MTAEFGTQFHRWLNNEFRTDGFESPWKIDFMDYMAEQSAKPKPRPTLKAKPAKKAVRMQSGLERQRERKYSPQEADYYRKRRLDREAKGICGKCGLRPMNVGKKQCEPCRVIVQESLRRSRARKAERRAA